MRGLSTCTSNDGPRDVSEMLGVTGSSGRDTSQTRLPKQATNASAIMISDVFMDVFMPPKITADRGGGQATEGPSVGRLSVSLS